MPEQRQPDRAGTRDLQRAEGQRSRERDRADEQRGTAPEGRAEDECQQPEERGEAEDDVRGRAPGVVRLGEPVVELPQLALGVRDGARRERRLLSVVERLHRRLDVVDRDEARDARAIRVEQPTVAAAGDRDPVPILVVLLAARESQVDRDRARTARLRDLRQHTFRRRPAHRLPFSRNQQADSRVVRRLLEADPHVVGARSRRGCKRGHEKARG